MIETHHINRRARQRGITKRMIELTLEYGKCQGDKIRLGKRRIKELIQNKKKLTQALKSELLKLLDKGGLVVVFSGATLITAYRWN